MISSFVARFSVLPAFHLISGYYTSLRFYRELMGSFCPTMMYDIFEAHTRRDATDPHTDRTAYIVKQRMDLLATGISRTQREASMPPLLPLLFDGNLKFQTLAARFGLCASVEITPRHQRGSRLIMPPGTPSA